MRVGDTVYVSGTVAWGDDGKLEGEGDVYAQARQALRNIERALAAAGATMGDVVRTRVYVTDMDRWQEAARAHAETFAEVKPAASMVEVSRLAEPAMLVEIEAVAVV